MTEQTSKNKPVHEIRLGRIKAAIWSNESESGTWHNVTLRRLYQLDGKWKETDSFGRDDLPLLEKVVAKAHDWIFEHAAQNAAS